MQAAERDAETRAIGAENLKAQKDATDEARRSLLRPVVTKSQRVGILSKIWLYTYYDFAQLSSCGKIPTESLLKGCKSWIASGKSHEKCQHIWGTDRQNMFLQCFYHSVETQNDPTVSGFPQAHRRMNATADEAGYHRFSLFSHPWFDCCDSDGLCPRTGWIQRIP